MTLGSRISEARDRAGKTQQEVADHFGITREAVSQWESDDTRPRSAKLSELTRFLGVHPAWLLDGFGPVSGNASLSLASLETVPVVGQIGAGAELFLYDDHPLGQGLEEVPAPLGVEGDDLVAVRIKGDSMRPMKEG
ncbi:MAG: helix-turn-helix domain-containing protein [Nitrospinota bacterium]|nr:helix-turn-helix domain-containing protein [Nitrospinota bacterium]